MPVKKRIQLNKEKTRLQKRYCAVGHFSVVLTSPQLSPFSSKKCQERDNTEAIRANQQTRQERKITARRGRVSRHQRRRVGRNMSGKFSPGAASRSWVTSHRSLLQMQHKQDLSETSDGTGCPLRLLSSRLQAGMCVNWSGTEAVAMGTKKGGWGVWHSLVLCSQSQRCILVKMLRGSKAELYVYHHCSFAVCTSESQIISGVIQG